MRFRTLHVLAGLTAALTLTSPSAAQVTQQEPVEVEFRGTITGSVSDTLLISQPGGATTPWTGPLPDYPYSQGDEISIRFNVTPARGFLTPDYPIEPVDGLYRFVVSGSQQYPGSVVGVARALGGFDVSGPIHQRGNSYTTGLELVYNIAADTYWIEPTSDVIRFGGFDGPTYQYDSESHSLSLIPKFDRRNDFICLEINRCNAQIFGSFNELMLSRIPIYDENGAFRPGGGFSLPFSGNWFVNGQQVSSNPVPEPPHLLILMAAVAVVAARRKLSARTD